MDAIHLSLEHETQSQRRPLSRNHAAIGSGVQISPTAYPRANCPSGDSFDCPDELAGPVPSSVVGRGTTTPASFASERTVLVVDDDQSIREALGDVLALLGYHVEMAGNGAQALECLRKGCDPFIILLDLGMPVMDGWQFRQALLKEPRFAATRVVVITAARDARLDSLNVNDVLIKPVPLERLVQVLESTH